MALQYEIFDSEVQAVNKTESINLLLGYPKPVVKTVTYREIVKHSDQNLWAAGIDSELINACSSMTVLERLSYYGSSDLKSTQYLTDNGWFPDPEGE